ncbi:unnamed protein product, partial [Didymodactylos carnosus]
HSGKISRKELRKVLNALSIQVDETELAQLMKQMDSNNSGDIEFDEFCQAMGQIFFKKHTRQELEAAFQKFDTDGSGYITANELSHIMARMGRNMKKSEIEAMIKSMDTTGDGKISLDEFVDMCNQ